MRNGPHCVPFHRGVQRRRIHTGRIRPAVNGAPEPVGDSRPQRQEGRMRIACIGGGPAGLYFAISAKMRDAGHDITVYERDPRGATYGWG